MDLYFLDNQNNQHLVKREVDIENVCSEVLEDLKTRKPGYVSFYQRTWWDNYFRYWIDYGSHTEFYILQKPDRALNVVDDAAEGQAPIELDLCEACRI